MPVLATALALALLASVPASGATIVLDFEEEPLGAVFSFLSAECGCVVLSERTGKWLRIFDDGSGDKILVPGRDFEGGTLVLDFVDVLVTGVAITFGGDSGDERVESFPAHLTGYIDGSEVVSATLEPNRNLLIDQTIAITSESPLDRAIFGFSQLGETEPLSALIGTITLTVATVPEPATMLLLGAAALGTVRRRSRSRRRPFGMFGAALTLAVTSLFAAGPASAATIVLDFEEEAVGTHTGPFVSAEHPGVTFSEDAGAFGELRILDYFLGTRSLSVGEEGGTLILDFAMQVTAVSLDFGNDHNLDPDVDAMPASLTGYAGGLEVAFAELAGNGNALVDQTLTISPGVAMDRVVFEFQQLGPDEPISPIVDSIVLTVLDVPEPALGLALALAAAAAVWGEERRRRASSSRDPGHVQT